MKIKQMLHGIAVFIVRGGEVGENHSYVYGTIPVKHRDKQTGEWKQVSSFNVRAEIYTAGKQIDLSVSKEGTLVMTQGNFEVQRQQNGKWVVVVKAQNIIPIVYVGESSEVREELRVSFVRYDILKVKPPYKENHPHKFWGLVQRRRKNPQTNQWETVQETSVDLVRFSRRDNDYQLQAATKFATVEGGGPAHLWVSQDGEKASLDVVCEPTLFNVISSADERRQGGSGNGGSSYGGGYGSGGYEGNSGSQNQSSPYGGGPTINPEGDGETEDADLPF